MNLKLKGARVVITAGGSGIGLAIAKAYLNEGATVAVCDIDVEAIENLTSEHPDINGTVCDVAELASLEAFMAESIKRMDGLDILVNNAGTAGPTAKVEDLKPYEWERCLSVCLTSQFNCSRLAIPALRHSSNASIVNLSSVAGRLGFAMRAPYAAAKWGVIGFTKSLAIELGDDGIRVNAILPGIVAGERQTRVLQTKAQQKGLSFEEMEAEAFSYTAIKEYVTANQIADQILFITSNRGRTISGQAISVCGDTRMLA